MIDRYFYEKKLWEQGFQRVMGLDEVGRGCLSGPVVAAGVILKPFSKLNNDIADSKSLTGKHREELCKEIKDDVLYWVVKECTPDDIDQMNILKASIQAMVYCTEESNAGPDYLLVDGNRFSNLLIPHSCIIKGDDKSVSIAAASIVAKVYRDQYMKRLHTEFPHFGWDHNAGYPTKKHYDGLLKYGYTTHHRKSFRLRTDKMYSKE